MSNCFSCNVRPGGSTSTILSEPFLGRGYVHVCGDYFFYCAQPNATSASIQNVKTNLREYCVERVKLDFCFLATSALGSNYVMFFILNVPQDYSHYNINPGFKLSDLPSHTIPENVLYYNLVRLDSSNTKNISIDIKKPFRVSPSYKLAFVCFLYSNALGDSLTFDGTAQVEFAVN